MDEWARFWAKVRESEAPSPNGMTGCWVWTASVRYGGYGQFRIGGRAGRVVRAHVLAYEWIVGQVPRGLELDHLCREPRCVNPAHLEAVTHRENLLRGSGPSAANARKTHCKHGHALTGANLLPSALPGRTCRTCSNAASRERKRRARASARLLTS